MRLRIHRGAKEIGGTCIEVEAAGKRLALDVGLPLDAPDEAQERLLPEVPGFREPDPGLLGVVISHGHMDHYGLAAHIRADIPVWIGGAAHNILKAARPWVPNGHAFSDPHFLADRKPFGIGPFRITPYLVDHSAFDAYALMVEAEGKRVFYSGDFRAHGRKAALFDGAQPAQGHRCAADGRHDARAAGTRERFETEDDLEARFAEAFRRTKGLHLVWTSSQNIDRVVTVFRAAKRTGRMLLIDLYTAVVLEATGRDTIPQSHWDEVKVYIPQSQRVFIKKNGLFADRDRHHRFRVYPKALPGLAERAVMLFRPLAMRDRGVQSVLEGASFTYSMWEGYLKEDSSQRVLRWLEAWHPLAVHPHLRPRLNRRPATLRHGPRPPRPRSDTLLRTRALPGAFRQCRPAGGRRVVGDLSR